MCAFRNRPVCDFLQAAIGFGGAGGHNFSAGVAAFGAQVDHVVGGLDHIEVVLDQDHGVARVHQPVQRLQQALDIGQVQPGGRLVEDVDRVLRRAGACSTRSRS